MLTADPSRIRYDVVHTEEGGRFYHARNRYLVVEAGPDSATRPATTTTGCRCANGPG